MSATLVASWLDPVLDLLFPAVCPVCGGRSDDARHRPFCAPCWQALPLLRGPGCVVCGAPHPGLADAFPCASCRRAPPAFDFARAAARYEGGMRAAIHALKYGGRPALGAPLGALLAEVGGPLLPGGAGATADAIVPIPLHPARQLARGFNQAELLATACARCWGIPLWPRALRRVQITRPQTDLDAPARRANVAGAFAVPEPGTVAGQRLLLVDDVLTTGATAGAAASTLRAAGAASVGVLVLARA